MGSIPPSNHPRKSPPAKVAARFWSKVEKSPDPDGCWIWTGARYPSGYGKVTINGETRYAHRVAWELTNGPIPPGKDVCHNCPGGDNPACCNPDHLWIGTPKDNSQDMIAKGRHSSKTHPEQLPRGCAHPGSKLTEAEVYEIRARAAGGGVTQTALAAEYGVAQPVISQIILRKTWRHI